jgi:alpha-glucosidase (family GH31 glycosyl hydrolase)
LLPRYALGNWWSRYWAYSEDELKELILDFEKREIPLSVCIIDMDWHVTDIPQKYGSGWTGYTWNKELFPNPQGFLSWLKSRKLYTSLNLHPALGIRGHEECYEDVADLMGIDASKDELIPFDCTDPRFMNAYFTKVHNPHEQKGCDFWWIDWQQGNNTAVEGLDPLWMLNHLHSLDLGRNKDKRPFIFSRWPGLGGHRYPIGFSGDTVVSWESLAFQPEFTATAANVGYGWWSHDIGGHFFGAEDPELYTRWVQFGVFSPIMRLHTSKNHYNKREPWKWNKIVEEITTKYMQLRHQFIPYLYTMSKRNENYGMPLITPMYYENNNHYMAYQTKDQYYFGSELLAAPFLNPMQTSLNKTKRKVWFPKGIWFDFFNGEVYEGDRVYPIYGSLEETPVYAKAGAIIPLAKLVKSNQHDNPEAMEIHVFPGDSNRFELYEDDGVSLAYKEGEYAITTYTTKYDNNSLELSIESQGELSVIPNNRDIEIRFRSIIENIKLECNASFKQSYDKESKTHIVVLDSYRAKEKINIKLTTTEDTLIDTKFDYIQKTMKLVDESTYETAQKEKVGFVYSKYGQLKRGILAKEATAREKALEILGEDIDMDLKEAVLAILLRVKE